LGTDDPHTNRRLLLWHSLGAAVVRGGALNLAYRCHEQPVDRRCS
jgi:hypothetical protein